MLNEGSSLERELEVFISKKRLRRIKNYIPSQAQLESKDSAEKQSDPETYLDSLKKIYIDLRNEYQVTDDLDEYKRIKEEINEVSANIIRETRENAAKRSEKAEERYEERRKEENRRSEARRKKRAANLAKDPDYYCKKAKKSAINAARVADGLNPNYKLKHLFLNREVTAEERQQYVAKFVEQVKEECRE